ncbi:MAG: hypothetical protein LUI05_05850 [Oscillospiraceae bacterium]|nr:hypothetical protein [Oscillospiraceae bacterium]
MKIWKLSPEIYIPLDGGKPYVLSNPTKIKNPQFSLFISRERVDIDNATYENCSRSNTKTLWYSDNRGDKHEIDDNSIIPRTDGQCTWYSMGRVSEKLNMSIDLNVNSERHGGNWIYLSYNAGETATKYQLTEELKISDREIFMMFLS